MAVPIVLLLLCEADLSIVAIGLGWKLSASRSAAVTGAVSIAFALALFALWAMWFVAPACIVNSDCAVPASSYANLVAGAAVQWAWLSAVALGARFAKERNLAHVSG